MSRPELPTRAGVLMVANFSSRTGYAWANIYRLFERIAMECDRHGLAPWASFARFEPPLEWEHAALFEGVLQLSPAATDLRGLWAWMRAIRRHRIRHVYFTDQPSWRLRYALFRLAGVRNIIVHSRVSVADPSPAAPERGYRGALKWLVCRLPFIQATRVYAVSDFVRDRLILKGRMPADRVVTILNGVDLERYAPRPSAETTGPVSIFCGGRATVNKGINVLIEAAALLRDEFGLSDFAVSYAGDGPDLQQFKALAEQHGLDEHFRFLGELSGTSDHVAAADIVVVPSVWGDACPSAVSEALACGKPLIATRAGGVPQLVGNEGAAILVEPGDSAGLAAALAELIENPEVRNALAHRARRRAEQALDQRRYYTQVLSQLWRDIGVASPAVAQHLERH